METYSFTLKMMRQVLLVCQLGLILMTKAQTPPECITSTTNRPPENDDITVVCGTEYMDLSIYICPMYNALYNESNMVVNNQVDREECYGKVNWTAVPPVLQFRFPLNETVITACKNDFKIFNEIGTGDFADFSNVQYVNISGIVNSVDPAAGMITYRPQILYKYSCYYPMQYVLNNTQLDVSGVNLAIRGDNGSFISTLSMQLYEDELYKTVLVIPPTGLNLKTKIYVAVKATNLTERFNVLLDRCYATTSPLPKLQSYYDLFVGCNRDDQTKVELNGESQKAHFSFEAFRFVEHKNLSISTFYLHCITRLCEVSTCSSLLPDCNNPSQRRKREVDRVSAEATVTSTPIAVGKEINDTPKPFINEKPSFTSDDRSSDYTAPVVAIIIWIIILSLLFLVTTIYFLLSIRRKKAIIQ